MFRFPVLALLLLVPGCSAAQPVAKVCNMPVGLRGWNGVTLRTTGIVVGGFEHGVSLMDEHCARGGELVGTSRTLNGDRMLERLAAIGSLIGIVRMDVEAKIETLDGATPKLRVSRYYGNSFEPMSHRQLSAFERRRSF
jgi:hypothetical protein